MTDKIATIVYWGAGAGFLAWALLSVLFRAFGYRDAAVFRVLAHVRAELHPFALPCIVARYLSIVWLERADNPYVNKDAILGLIVMATIWWNNRRNDDDRWKRRGKRVSSRIRVTATGLRVVPAGASTR